MVERGAGGRPDVEPAPIAGSADAANPRIDPDLDLVERCQRKQPGAFEALVRRYQDRVFSLAFRFLRDRAIAEEVAQDVFVSVFQHVQGFQKSSKFSTWLFRIVANQCHNKAKYLRRRKHHQQESIDSGAETEDGELRRELPAEGESPEELSARRRLNARIQDAISALDEDHRLIVLLRDVEDLSYEEIGEALGLAEGTVKSRLHRARNELRARLSNTDERSR